MKALRISNTGIYKGEIADLAEPVLRAEQVLVRVHYSALNYKDALAITGRGRIIRKFPLIAGIDLAGEVLDAGSAPFHRGTKVLATGCGLGEEHDGGYCEVAAVAAEHLLALPQGLTLKEAMTLGTAGFTAALCLEQMEHNGQTPELGDIVITGASGGVGSSAVAIFSQRGYRVLAVSDKQDSYTWLRQLGADKICTTTQLLEHSSAPLTSVQWGGAIDNLGGTYLKALLKATALHGNVACVGLASSADLNSTVFPHILRGVNLLGISSNNCPPPQRHRLWQRLAVELKPRQFDMLCGKEITLTDLPEVAAQMLARKTSGRILVRMIK